jgi:hypothetical protein
MMMLKDIGLNFENIKGFYFLLILLTLPVILNSPLSIIIFSIAELRHKWL